MKLIARWEFRRVPLVDSRKPVCETVRRSGSFYIHVTLIIPRSSSLAPPVWLNLGIYLATSSKQVGRKPLRSNLLHEVFHDAGTLWHSKFMRPQRGCLLVVGQGRENQGGWSARVPRPLKVSFIIPFVKSISQRQVKVTTFATKWRWLCCWLILWISRTINESLTRGRQVDMSRCIDSLLVLWFFCSKS